MIKLIATAAPKNAPSSHDRQSGQVTNTQFVFRYDWTCWQVTYLLLVHSSNAVTNNLKNRMKNLLPCSDLLILKAWIVMINGTLSFVQTMQEKLEAGAELMPDRQSTLDPLLQPSQSTPIRKHSRNRGRESRNANNPENDGDDVEPEDAGQRHSKRARRR